MTAAHGPELPGGTSGPGQSPGTEPSITATEPSITAAEPSIPDVEPLINGNEPAITDVEPAIADVGPGNGRLPGTEPDQPAEPTGSDESDTAEQPDQVGEMARLEIRGPFLLMFALAQQQSSLLHHAMADRPLQPAEFAVYSALRLSQPTTPTQLAATLGMKATTLSSMLVRMAKNGHLKRRRNPADGRSVVLSLSPAGVRATEESFASFSVAIESFRRHLEIEEPALLHSLEAMSRALSKAMVELSSGQTQATAGS